MTTVLTPHLLFIYFTNYIIQQLLYLYRLIIVSMATFKSPFRPTNPSTSTPRSSLRSSLSFKIKNFLNVSTPVEPSSTTSNSNDVPSKEALFPAQSMELSGDKENLSNASPNKVSPSRIPRLSLNVKAKSPLKDYNYPQQMEDYDGDMHLPKYSQSEVDAMLEEYQLKKEKTLSNATTSSASLLKLQEMESTIASQRQEISSLDSELAQQKSTVALLTEKINDNVLIRTQNKALSRRLEELEDMLAAKEEQYATSMKAIVAEEAERREALIEEHKKSLTEAYATAKKEVKLKVQEQFEAGNKLYHKARQDFKELRIKYDERLVELKEARNKTDMAQMELDTEMSELLARANEVSELKGQIETLQRDKSSLIQAAVSSQAAIVELEDVSRKLRDEVNNERCAVSEVRIMLAEHENERQSLKIEFDGHMTLIARLTSEKISAERHLTAAQEEVAELTKRCSNLRAMNKEMLGMLEGGEKI